MHHRGLLEKLILPFAVIFFSFVLAQNIFLGGSHYSNLAQSFLQGKLYFLNQPDGTWIDTSFFAGRYYWPAGPLPAIILLPFVAVSQIFGFFFYQGYIQPLLVICVFLLVYAIAKKYGYRYTDSLFWAYGFCFSTVFINVALWPDAWGFAQVISVALMFLSIYGYIKDWPHALLGLLAGLVGASRFAASGIFFLFFLLIFFSKYDMKVKIKQLFSFIMPFTLVIFLIGLYNLGRFGNFFDSGYAYQILTNTNLEKAREYGLFSLIHVPGNLYYFLLSTPLPVFKASGLHVFEFPFIRANPWGMSVFVTSPLFIKLFFIKYKDKLSVFILAAAIIISLPIFLYYGIGWRQAGYRYSLDFLPLIYWLLIKNYTPDRKLLSPGFKILIFISSFLNFYFVLTAFLYP